MVKNLTHVEWKLPADMSVNVAANSAQSLDPARARLVDRKTCPLGRFGLVWFGLVWFGLVWFGLVWLRI
jgi:hypothetical protein